MVLLFFILAGILDLSDNALTGTLPPVLGDISMLGKSRVGNECEHVGLRYRHLT